MQLIRKTNGRTPALLALSKELGDLRIEDLDVDEAYSNVMLKVSDCE